MKWATLGAVLFLPGCVAWQSSIDEIRETLEQTNTERSEQLSTFMSSVLGRIEQSEGVVATATQRMKDELEGRVSTMQSWMEEQAQTPEGVTTASFQAAVQGLRDDLAAVMATEVKGVEDELERTKIEIAGAESLRKSEETLAIEKAVADVQRIAIENQQQNAQLFAMLEETAKLTAKPFGLEQSVDLALSSMKAAMDGKLEEMKAELAAKLPSAAREVAVATGRDPDDIPWMTEEKLMEITQWVLSALALGAVGHRKLTEDKRYAKKISQQTGQPPPAATS